MTRACFLNGVFRVLISQPLSVITLNAALWRFFVVIATSSAKRNLISTFVGVSVYTRPRK